MVLGIFAELMTPGGIQCIGRHQAAVLSSFAKDRGLPCRLLSLNDSPGQQRLRVGGVALTIQGFGRRKGRLLLATLAAAPGTRVAYIGHPNLAPLGLLLRILRPGMRYWVATYGVDVWEPLAPMRRIALRSAHAITTISQYTGEKLVAVQKLNRKRVDVIPPALDPGFGKMNGVVPHPRPPLPTGKLLLTVARLASSERGKGIDGVIRALPIVHKVVPDTHYVIVGDGDDRLRLERLARDVGVSDHVFFPGMKMGDEFASFYDACDVFVMPSRKEGFGIVFLEAMAYGKPVIGGNHGGTPEVVIDGTTGFLLEFGDVNALADCLIRLLQDEALCRRMGEAGRHRLEQHYTFEHFQRRFLRVLEEGS